MGVRLSRSKSNPVEDGYENSIMIEGTPGTNYNLDEITDEKSRTSNSAITVGVLDENNVDDGSIKINSSKNKILLNNADAKKYLFDNEPSTASYTPTITLRRPIVFFREGTPDANTDSSYGTLEERLTELENEFYEKNIKMENQYISLEKSINDINNILANIDASNKDHIIDQEEVLNKLETHLEEFELHKTDFDDYKSAVSSGIGEDVAVLKQKCKELEEKYTNLSNILNKKDY